MQRSLVERLENKKALVLLLLIAVMSLVPRVESYEYIPESLWAEDGTLLITQAHQFGVRSLWMPSAGYLHLYHRIVALVAAAAPLSITPFIFLSGWICAFLLIVWVITSRGYLAGLDRTEQALLILAISLQPNDGETFLNLGQSFYFLNIAFALYACLPAPKPIRLPYLIILSLLSLSGPASELISLILLVRILIIRDFGERKWEYITVWSLAVLQIFLTLASYREYSPEPERNPINWINAVVVFLCFGSQSHLVKLAAVTFWSTTLIYLIYNLWSLKSSFRDALWFSPLLAMLTAGTFFLAGMVREGDDVVNMNPLDHEARYYVLPYALCFFVAFSATRNKPSARMAITLSLGLICGGTFLTLDRAGRMGTTGMYDHENMQWSAFVKFQKLIPDLIIPINPAWAIWPPLWTVQVAADRSNLQTKAVPIYLSITNAKSTDLESVTAEDGLFVSSEKRSPMVEFSLENHCSGRQYLAVEVDAWRSKPGWVRLYWGGQRGFSERRSLKRFYPDGDVTMQFAFQRGFSDTALRLDLMEGVGRWLLQDWVRKWLRRYPDFLEENFGHPTLVPPPTEPGGQARIKQLRLYCLDP